MIGELAGGIVTTAPTSESGGWLRKTLKLFGPGLITGAADDDPSGIATYSSFRHPIRYKHALDDAFDMGSNSLTPPSDCHQHQIGRRRLLDTSEKLSFRTTADPFATPFRCVYVRKPYALVAIGPLILLRDRIRAWGSF